MNRKPHKSLRVVEWDRMTACHANVRIDKRFDHPLDRIGAGNCVCYNQNQDIGLDMAEKYVDSGGLPFAGSLCDKPDERVLFAEFEDDGFSTVSTAAGHDQYFIDFAGGRALFQHCPEGFGNIGRFVIRHDADAAVKLTLEGRCNPVRQISSYGFHFQRSFHLFSRKFF